MIRVNLLKNRREPVDGLEAAIAASGPSAFINRREIVAGALFLALGAGILYLHSTTAGFGEADLPPVAAASDERAPRPAEQPSVKIEAARLESAAPPQPRVAGRQPQAAAIAAAAEAVRSPRVAPTAPRETARVTPAAAPAVASPAGESSAARSLSPPTPRHAAARAPASSPSPRSELAGGQLSSLDISSRGPALTILATIGTQPAYQMFRLNSPNRVVVDLSGVTLALPAAQRQLTPSHPLVERIRVAQFQVSPPKVRMVFDVSEFPEIAIEPAPEGLAFQVAAPAP